MTTDINGFPSSKTCFPNHDATLVRGAEMQIDLPMLARDLRPIQHGCRKLRTPFRLLNISQYYHRLYRLLNSSNPRTNWQLKPSGLKQICTTLKSQRPTAALLRHSLDWQRYNGHKRLWIRRQRVCSWCSKSSVRDNHLASHVSAHTRNSHSYVLCV